VVKICFPLGFDLLLGKSLWWWRRRNWEVLKRALLAVHGIRELGWGLSQVADDVLKELKTVFLALVSFVVTIGRSGTYPLWSLNNRSISLREAEKFLEDLRRKLLGRTLRRCQK
jgi:hypothetical protein